MGTVPVPQTSVALGDSACGGQVQVLSVHVGATAGVVAQPDAKVLPPKGGFFEHLPTVNDFPLKTSSSSVEIQSTKVELGNNVARCKDAHAVEGWWVALGSGQAAPHHLVISKCARGLHGVHSASPPPRKGRVSTLLPFS